MFRLLASLRAGKKDQARSVGYLAMEMMVAVVMKAPRAATSVQQLQSLFLGYTPADRAPQHQG